MALLIEHCTATPELNLTFNEIANLAHGSSRVDIKLVSLSYDEVHKANDGYVLHRPVEIATQSRHTEVGYR